MAKNKRQKYQRVKHLPNVTITESDTAGAPGPYPWEQPRFAGMRRVLELGCGKGEHSLAFAAADPGTLYVGIDRKSDRLCVGAETALAQKIDNVLFLRGRIEFLATYFKPRSISAIWLTFPDPHIKHRRNHLRLCAPSFLDIYAGLLVAGGRVHLKTDSAFFFDYARESVVKWGGHIVACLEDLHAGGDRGMGGPQVVSAFEQIALGRGEAIKYLAFQLDGNGLPWVP